MTDDAQLKREQRTWLRASEPGSSQYATEFQKGELIGDRYRILSILGKGGMGVVYRVEQVFLRKELALKTMDKHLLSDVTVRRFQQEAQAAFAVDHPNIVSMHDFGLLDDETPFLVMEIVNGETLSTRLKKAGALSIEETLPIFIQICFGLAHAHEKGVVHRDIKPSNIMLVDQMPTGSEGSVKILDFGIAKLTQNEEGEIQALTKTGEIFGSPLYMSPEQCTGGKVDQRADVYSLGCVLFECLIGTTPFVGENALSTMMKHQSELVPSLKEASLGGEFSEELERVLKLMLAKQPDDRYQNLGITAHDLSAISRGEKIVFTRNSQPNWDKARKPFVSVPLFYFLIALTGISIAVAGFTLLKPLTVREIPPGVAHNAEIGAASKAADSIINAVRDPAGLSAQLKTNSEVVKLAFQNVSLGEFKQIAKSPWITNLNLTQSKISNEALDRIIMLPLVHISLSSSNLNDIGARQLKKMTRLKHVEADWTDITEDGVKSLASIDGLLNLEISGVKLSQAAINKLAGHKKLLRLKLQNATGFIDKELEPFSRSNLEYINLGGTVVSDASMTYLANIKNLRSAALCGTGVTADGLETLLQNKSIECLYIEGCKITKNSLQILRNRHPDVKILEKPPSG